MLVCVYKVYDFVGLMLFQTAVFHLALYWNISPSQYFEWFYSIPPYKLMNSSVDIEGSFPLPFIAER